MKCCLWTRVLTVLMLSAGPAAAQTAADSAGVRATALDYIDGWWSADAQRMASALHPELVKRIRGMDANGGREWIDQQGASRLIRGTGRGGGRETPVAAQRSDVRILDIFQNTASVRVDAGPWVDYLQMVRWGGRWVILNVLWEMKRPSLEYPPGFASRFVYSG
jgi:hypothetical protein